MRLYVQLSVLLAVLMVAPAAAQNQLAPALALSPAQASAALADNQTQELVWSVTNSGPTNAVTSLALTVPPGWSATITEPTATSFTLNGVTPLTPQPGTQVVRVVVTPGLGAQNATLVLAATGTNPAGQSSSAQATAVLTYIPPPPPPPPQTPWARILGWTAAGLAAVLVGLYLFVATRPRIRLSALALNEYAGTRATVSVLIENRSRRARRIDLRLRGLASPWAGALMVPHVLLDARASTDIPVAVQVPFQGAVGDQRTVHVQARPHGLYPWLVRRRVTVTIAGMTPIVHPPEPVPAATGLPANAQ